LPSKFGNRDRSDEIQPATIDRAHWYSNDTKQVVAFEVRRHLQVEHLIIYSLRQDKGAGCDHAEIVFPWNFGAPGHALRPA
jgi:hypothetical protein